MAVMNRGGNWYIYFRPFKDKKIGVKLDVESKAEAKGIEAMLTRACRTGNYSALDGGAQQTCVRMFVNQRWELPSELGGTVTETPREELTLWRACEIFLKYPTIKECKAKQRYIYCLQHFVEKWGKPKHVKDLWVPDIRLYQSERLSDGAKPTTVNWELATLSKLFGVLQELQLVEANPCRLVKQLSAKTSERDIYLSFQDVQSIVDHVPAWMRAVVLFGVLFWHATRRDTWLDLETG